MATKYAKTVYFTTVPNDLHQRLVRWGTKAAQIGTTLIKHTKSAECPTDYQGIRASLLQADLSDKVLRGISPRTVAMIVTHLTTRIHSGHLPKPYKDWTEAAIPVSGIEIALLKWKGYMRIHGNKVTLPGDNQVRRRPTKVTFQHAGTERNPQRWRLTVWTHKTRKRSGILTDDEIVQLNEDLVPMRAKAQQLEDRKATVRQSNAAHHKKKRRLDKLAEEAATLDEEIRQYVKQYSRDAVACKLTVIEEPTLTTGAG